MGHVHGLRILAAQRLLHLAQGQAWSALHTQVHHHGSGQVGSPGEVVHGPAGQLFLAPHQQFRRPARQQHLQLPPQIRLIGHGPFWGDGQVISRRASGGGQDGYPGDLVFRQQAAGSQGMARLVKGDDRQFFPRGHRLLIRSGHRAHKGLLDIAGRNGPSAPARRPNGCLVYQGFQGSAAKGNRLGRQLIQIHLPVQGFPLQVQRQNSLALLAVGQPHFNLPVESARPQQSRV